MTVRSDSLSDKLVAVVEDNATQRELMVLMLEELGCHVVAFDSGADLISCLDELNIHLVLLDWNLSGAIGRDVLESLRARDATVPVIVISGETDPLFAESCIATGALKMMSKPVRMAAVSKMLEEINALGANLVAGK